MFDFRYKNASNMHDSHLKRTDSLAMLRRKRRYIVNDERRACVDRCESALSSPLLRYLVRLRNCSDAQRDILALLIFEQPVHLKKTIDELYSMGMIPMVVQCLTTDNINDLLRWCACRIIARIISHDNVEHINELNRCNFLANIVPSIDTENDEQYNCVCKIIASIIHKDNVIYPTFRLELLVNLVNTFARTLKSKTGDLINDIIRVMIDRSEFNGVWSEAILPQIFRMIQSNQMVEMNLRLLSSLTDGYGFHDRSEKIVQYRFIPELVKLISWPLAIQLVTLKVIKNISKGYDEHIFDLLNANLLVPLKEILQKSNLKILRHLTLDILSNISGGHRTDVLALINAGFVPIVLDIMHTGDNKSQLFATWIINNITNRGNIDDIKFIIECGALGVLCKMLPMPDNDIIINTLGALSQILISYRQHAAFRDVINTIEEFDGFNSIESLQQHENSDICLLAFEINESLFFHENYFEDEIVALLPTANKFQFQFDVDEDDWDSPLASAISF